MFFSVRQTEGKRYTILQYKSITDKQPKVVVDSLKFPLSYTQELRLWLQGVQKDPEAVLKRKYEEKYGKEGAEQIPDIIIPELKLEKDFTPSIKLRGYQEEDLQAIEENLQVYPGVLYCLPTGGWKSVVLSTFIEKHENKKILVLAHKRKLLLQLESHLTKRNLKPGLIFAGINKNPGASILIASIRSVVKDHRLDNLLQQKWDYIIIDEARHTRTKSYDEVLHSLKIANPQVKLLWVDATPYRRDGKSLEEHFQKLVLSVEDIQSLIDKKYLANIRTYTAPIGDIKQEVKENQSDYVIAELSTYMRKDTFISYLIETYEKFGEQRQAIVFAVDIEHAKTIVKKFEEEGYTWKVAKIDSSLKSKEIDDIIEKFEKGDIQILVNVEMLTEGVDLPECSCIIGARPTKSLSLYLQMAGRGTRPKKDGWDLIILDCCGWTDDYGQVTSKKEWSLNPNWDPNARRKQTKIFAINKGRIVEDVDLINYVGEVAELTPEEYIERLGDAIGQAKAKNKLIISQVGTFIENNFEKLEERLGLKSKEYGLNGFFDLQSDKYPSYVWTLPGEFDIDEYRRSFSISIEVPRGTFGSLWYNPRVKFRESNIDKYKETSEALQKVGKGYIFYGKLLEAFWKNPKIEKSIEKMYDQAQGKLDSRVDIDKLKQEKKEERKDQIFTNLESKWGAWEIDLVEFPVELHLDRHRLGAYGYFNGISLGAPSKSKKLRKQWNYIAFYRDGDRRDSKGNATIEEIKDILWKGYYGREEEYMQEQEGIEKNKR